MTKTDDVERLRQMRETCDMESRQQWTTPRQREHAALARDSLTRVLDRLEAAEARADFDAIEADPEGLTPWLTKTDDVAEDNGIREVCQSCGGFGKCNCLKTDDVDQLRSEHCGGSPGKPFVVMGTLKMDPCPGCPDCAAK